MGARPIAVLDALRFGDPAGAADPAPRRRRRAWRRRLRQLRRRPDGRRRARLRSQLPGQPAGQRDGDRAAREERRSRWRPRPGRATSWSCSARRPGATGSAAHRCSPARRSPTTTLQATERPGRRPVRREAADRGVARADRARPGRGPPGPGRRRDHLRHLGDRRPGRNRDPRRPRRDPAARARAGAVRGDDLRVAGADVRGRPARPMAGGPRGLRALGPAGRDHRPGDRRRRHRGRRGRAGRRRPCRRRRPRDRPDPGPRADQRRDRPRPGGPRPDPSTGRPGPGRPGRRQRPAPRARHGPGRRPAGAARVGQPRRRGGSSTSSTTRPSARTPWPDRDTARPCCGSRARPRPSSPRPTGTTRSGSVDPWLGAALSVAEATRNVSITGARPLGVTNCLNYGDPTRPEAFWQLSEGVRGLGDACRALGLPVTGGNVSLYNESPTGPIAPTPEIGVVGLLDDVATLVGPAFGEAGDAIVLVGDATPGLVGSAYAAAGRRDRRRRRRPTSTSRARRRSRRSSARRSRAASSPRPRTSRVAAWRSRWPSARCGAASAPRSGWPSSARRRSRCSGRARRGSS